MCVYIYMYIYVYVYVYVYRCIYVYVGRCMYVYVLERFSKFLKDDLPIGFPINIIISLNEACHIYDGGMRHVTFMTEVCHTYVRRMNACHV